MANITSANDKARAEQIKKHYKNKNYDPVKAHNYYLKHRKLKGRKKKASSESSSKGSKKKSKKDRLSTDGLNEAGLLASSRAKAEMTVKLKEFTQKLTDHLKQRNAEIDSDTSLSDHEKAVQKQMLADSITAMKKQGKEILTEGYAQEMDKIKTNKEYSK